MVMPNKPWPSAKAERSVLMILAATEPPRSRIFWDEFRREMTLVDPESKRREIERDEYELRCRVARQNLVYQLEALVRGACWLEFERPDGSNVVFELDWRFWIGAVSLGLLLPLAHALLKAWR